MNTTIVTASPENVKDDNNNAFCALLGAFECAPRNYEYLYPLAKAIASSVIRKTIDPQRKSAETSATVSNSGYNAVMVEMRRGIYADAALLDNTRDANNRATAWRYDSDGYVVSDTIDSDANTAASKLIGETLTDGIDIVHEAAAALLEQYELARNRMVIDPDGDGAEKCAATELVGWMQMPYTINRLSKKVYVKLDDSAAYREEEITPIQEVYRAVRRYIANSRAVQTDPRNGYTYIEDYAAGDDGALETIYFRMKKHADIGGYAVHDCYSNSPGDLYTADIQTVRDIDAIISALDLTPRQATIIDLRMRGMGYRAIATYLGVKFQTIETTVSRIRKKWDSLRDTITPET